MNESWTELESRPAVERASAAEFLAPVVEYAASELLRDGHDLARALPEVLAKLGAPLACRCVLALRQDVAQPLTVIAAHPAEVVADAALLTELNELTVVHRGAARAGHSFSEPLRWAQPLPGEPDGDVQLSVLMAYSAPSDDHRLCTIALVSEEGVWTADAHSASRVIAGIVAAHLRHAADQARFWALAKAAPVGIVQLDAGGLCTFTNDRWSEMTGMTAQDALGAGWAAALHPEDATRIEREWAVAAARGTELHTSCRLIAPDCTEIWADTTAIPLRNAAGQPAGFVSAVIDVTDRKRVEAEQESQRFSD